MLKPGGTIVIATWCQREETPQTPFRWARVLCVIEGPGRLCRPAAGPGRLRCRRHASLLAVLGITRRCAAGAAGNTPPLVIRRTPLPPCCIAFYSERDQERLRFLYEEWAHPYFVSKEEYGRIMEVSSDSYRAGQGEG